MHLGPWEIGLLIVIAFIVFGPKRLPELAKSLGEGIREFKRSISGVIETPETKPTEHSAADDKATR